MNKITHMSGITLLEVLLACFILTGSTLTILAGLWQQRVTLDQLNFHALVLRLLENVSYQLQKTPCAPERTVVATDWQRLVSHLLPYNQATLQCSALECVSCISGLHNEDKQCLAARIVASPCSN